MKVNRKVLEEFFKRHYYVSKEGKVFNNQNIELKGWLDDRGYLKVGLRIKDYKIPKSVKIHLLQAYQKFGNKIFEENIVVRHFNGNAVDNSWDNILIGTHSDNRLDIPKLIRIESATTASRKMQDNSRTYEERCKIYDDLNSGLTYSEIMKKHNISSKGTLSFMKNKSLEYKEYITGVACTKAGDEHLQCS